MKRDSQRIGLTSFFRLQIICMYTNVFICTMLFAVINQRYSNTFIIRELRVYDLIFWLIFLRVRISDEHRSVILKQISTPARLLNCGIFSYFRSEFYKNLLLLFYTSRKLQ